MLSGIGGFSSLATFIIKSNDSNSWAVGSEYKYRLGSKTQAGPFGYAFTLFVSPSPDKSMFDKFCIKV